MGYILKKSTGGGGGDATAANQQKQIDQLAEASAYPSVLKDVTDESVFTQKTKSVFVGDRGDLDDYGVFKDIVQESNFKDRDNESLFKDNQRRSVFKDTATGKTVFKETQTPSETTIGNLAYLIQQAASNILQTQTKQSYFSSTWQIQSFTNTTVSGLAAAIETFIQANGGAVYVNLSFSSGGVTQHDALLTYVL